MELHPRPLDEQVGTIGHDERERPVFLYRVLDHPRCVWEIRGDELGSVGIPVRALGIIEEGDEYLHRRAEARGGGVLG